MARKKGKIRLCSKCKQAGHDARNCTTIINSNPEIEEKISKTKLLGHKLIAKEIEDREEIDGLVPQKGHWIINEEYKRIAGRITKVKKTGEICYRNALGACMTTRQGLFKEEGYRYLKAEDFQPEMLKWDTL